MLSLLNTPKSWLIASMFAATAVSAQQNKNQVHPQTSYERGHEASNCQMMASYSAPAGFNVSNSWDVYATASFIYWQARQENMEIGLISKNQPEGLIAAPDSPFTTSYVNNITTTSPNFTYRPGFKVGLGANLNWDDWDAYAEYTWFHGSIGSGVKPLPPASLTSLPPNGQYLYPVQGIPVAEGSLFFQDADQSWSLKMDFLDISLARAYYSGTKLTIRPFFGARGAWIRQSLNTSYNGSSLYSEVDEVQKGYFTSMIFNDSASWGVGPRTGFESNWLLGYGFQLLGNASADILYTRYSTRLNEQTYQFAGVLPDDHPSPIFSNASVSQEIDYLRTHLDLEMGFGWGSYFCRNEYHIDLSATYGFQVFWDQNMFRNFTDDVMQGKSNNPNGNLYVHGLTADVRFDF